jgi:hypothetical protein
LTDINLTLTAFTLILFTLFVIVLSKFAWGPLLAAIDEREKSIREALEGSQKANAEAAALLAQHKDLVRQIGAEREEIIKKATKEAEEFRIDLMPRRAPTVTTSCGAPRNRSPGNPRWLSPNSVKKWRTSPCSEPRRSWLRP